MVKEILLNLAITTRLFDNDWLEATVVNNDVGELPSRLGTNLALKNLPPSVESLLMLKPE